MLSAILFTAAGQTTRHESHFALRANMLRWVTLTTDMGLEWNICNHWSVVANGSWTSWKWKGVDRRYALWEVSPEVRYYFSNSGIGSKYNSARSHGQLPFYVGLQYKQGSFNYKLSQTGKQGDILGGGVVLGYMLPLNRSLSIDFKLGAGCLLADFDTYNTAGSVRVRDESYSKSVWGITDWGVTLVWILK